MHRTVVRSIPMATRCCSSSRARSPSASSCPKVTRSSNCAAATHWLFRKASGTRSSCESRDAWCTSHPDRTAMPVGGALDARRQVAVDVVDEVDETAVAFDDVADRGVQPRALLLGQDAVI